eukprot:m51a1_g12660 hypothetical protein (137) ;mRNA; f:1918-2473
MSVYAAPSQGTSCVGYPPPPYGYPPPAQPQPAFYAAPGVAPVVLAAPAVVVTDAPSGQGFPYRDVSAKVRCQYCSATVCTETSFDLGLLTWLAVGALCLLQFYLCMCVPCCMRSLKDVVHSCPSCGKVVGRYSRMS